MATLSSTIPGYSSPTVDPEKPAIGPTAEPEIKKSSTSSSAPSNGFLTGKATGKPGRVQSPYPPYQELDVSGLSSGSLALDPTTKKVFQVP